MFDAIAILILFQFGKRTPGYDTGLGLGLDAILRMKTKVILRIRDRC